MHFITSYAQRTHGEVAFHKILFEVRFILQELEVFYGSVGDVPGYNQPARAVFFRAVFQR